MKLNLAVYLRKYLAEPHPMYKDQNNFNPTEIQKFFIPTIYEKIKYSKFLLKEK